VKFAEIMEQGLGLWTDIDCSDVLFEHNRMAANEVALIFFGINSGAISHDNEVQNETRNGRVLSEAPDLHQYFVKHRDQCRMTDSNDRTLEIS